MFSSSPSFDLALLNGEKKVSGGNKKKKRHNCIYLSSREMPRLVRLMPNHIPPFRIHEEIFFVKNSNKKDFLRFVLVEATLPSNPKKRRRRRFCICLFWSSRMGVEREERKGAWNDADGGRRRRRPRKEQEQTKHSFQHLAKKHATP